MVLFLWIVLVLSPLHHTLLLLYFRATPSLFLTRGMNNLQEARCHRLNKVCVPSVSTARRGPKHHTASRSARLEERLEDLVSLLRKSQNVPERSQANEASKNHGHTSKNDEGLCGKENNPYTPFTPSTTITTTSSTASTEVYFDEPSPIEADICLRRFREEAMVGSHMSNTRSPILYYMRKTANK